MSKSLRRRLVVTAVVLFNASRVSVTRALDQPWTFDRVVAAVEWREAQFANCSFSFTEEVMLIRDEKPLFTLAAEVKVRQPKTRVRYDFDFPGHPQLTLRGAEWVWDGKQSLSLGKRASDAKVVPSGDVSEVRPDFLKRKSFELMGTLFPEERVSAQLRAAAARRQAKVKVFESEDRGERTVTVRIEAASLAYPIVSYAFLPEKDMLLRTVKDTLYKDDALRQVPLQIGTQEAAKLENRDGIWVPTEILCERDAGDAKNSFTYRLKAFSRNGPAAEEFTLPFPPGTEVNDRIAGSMYRVEPDGSHAQLPFFDADTGKMVEPPATQPATTKPAARPGQ